jgi:hypothetical protein
MNSEVGKMGKYQAVRNIVPITLVDSRLKPSREMYVRWIVYLLVGTIKSNV